MRVADGDIAAGQALTVTLDVAAPRAAASSLGRVTLSSHFPFGLWRGWAYVHFPLAGIVFPAAEIGAPPLPRGHGGADPLAQGASDDADLAGLREYQRGDPPQRVAWKAVARGAGWYSKEFDGAGGGGPVALAWDALPRLAAGRSATVAPDRMGARRRARRASVLAVASRRPPAAAAGTRPSPRRARLRLAAVPAVNIAAWLSLGSASRAAPAAPTC